MLTFIFRRRRNYDAGVTNRSKKKDLTDEAIIYEN